MKNGTFDERNRDATWHVLVLGFPDGCACAENAPIAKAFKSLEKYELAVQCDDHADSE